ncbi:hypothetical protein C1T17_11870 [Sphingobium sp. SCG-1]|uniref:hypothetical protein n=1 Tax=Sphingobium sp. SCG-1 TaxID=2072936 RepID=UPI000CD6A4E9|nr:hypothetical protein [Sphingobium sp. SCG-1]AUW58691.1 hypothetical protein C1T17_11870 [Sphingobium sp. SCG-1]
MSAPHFDQFAVIDWSGQAVARPAGLAVAQASSGDDAPTLLRPDGGWSREAILQWLFQHAEAGRRILIGLDLSPAFPYLDCGSYFPGWNISPETGPELWALIDALCTNDSHLSANGFINHPEARRYFRQRGDCGDLFPAGSGRFRICEHGQAAMRLSPYSCFNLVGAAQVGKSSLTGMRVLHRLRGIVPVWPFDPVPDSGPLIVEIYTALAARAAGLRKGLSKIRTAPALDEALAAFATRPHAPLDRYDDHSTDAILTTAWLRRAAQDDRSWHPEKLTREIARTEGWTFGVI